MSQPSNVGRAAQELRRAADEWGAKPGTPEGAFLRGMADLAEAVGEQVGAQPAGAVEAAVRRAAAAGLGQAAKQVAVSALWGSRAAILAVAVVALGVGAAAGWEAGGSVAHASDTVEFGTLTSVVVRGGAGAAWLATIAASNDLDERAHWCADLDHQAIQDGGIVCQVPLWIRPPGARW
jgi:hypothetical protein